MVTKLKYTPRAIKRRENQIRMRDMSLANLRAANGTQARGYFTIKK